MRQGGTQGVEQPGRKEEENEDMNDKKEESGTGVVGTGDKDK